ncbi:MAG: hypothetical protein NZ898_14375 [Myxococcota bacterium]|nr:hypothetical protein [Myxococcota bacterium]MDW8360849.1 hypothetical protein [Myxococcales bacterium]
MTSERGSGPSSSGTDADRTIQVDGVADALVETSDDAGTVGAIVTDEVAGVDPPRTTRPPPLPRRWSRGRAVLLAVLAFVVLAGVTLGVMALVNRPTRDVSGGPEAPSAGAPSQSSEAEAERDRAPADIRLDEVVIELGGDTRDEPGSSSGM